MIHLNNINLVYGERYVLKDLNLTIKDRDKIGLIGRNGTGKSSLFRIIAGDSSPTDGHVEIENEASIGVLRQDIELPKGISAKEACMEVLDEFNKLTEEYHRLEKEIANRTDYESPDYMSMLDRFSALSEKIAMLNPDKMEAEVERILKGLGFTEASFNKKLETLSGGWRMRVELAKILVRRPDYILLDEPNNHLDIYSIIWLEKFIKNYPGSVLLISHDSTFLSNTADRILEIEQGVLQKYNCGYEKYLIEKVDRKEKQKAAYENQQRVIADKQRTINRFMAKATKTKMAQSMQKQLDKMERVEFEDFNAKDFVLRTQYSKRSGRDVYKVMNLHKAYGSLKVLEGVDLLIERGEKVAFIGQNGQGKSTLVKLMVGAQKYDSGEIVEGVNVDLGYYAQNQEDLLDPNKTVLRTLEDVIPEDQRTKTRKILGSFLFSGEDVEKKVMVLSGGERARLAMACMFCHPLNVIIMDEPTNHLDIPSKIILKNAISNFEGTVILVSHDRDFMKGWLNKVYAFRNGEVQEHIGGIEEYLESSGLEDMREVEKNEDSVTVSTQNQNGSKLTREEEKKIRRSIQYIERDIEKAEKEIAAIEQKLMDPNVFKSPEGQDLSQKHIKLKEEVSALEEKWEMECGKL